MYGIDWDGPIAENTNENNLEVPNIPCPLLDTDLDDLKENINPLRESSFQGVDIYLETVEFVEERTRNNVTSTVNTQNRSSMVCNQGGNVPPGPGGSATLNSTSERNNLINAPQLFDQHPGQPPAPHFGH